MLSIFNKNIKELALANAKLIALAALPFIIGVVGIIIVFIHGQEASYGVSREAPWGLLLMGYAYFVGISVGISVLIAIEHIFHVNIFTKNSKELQLLAIASLTAAFWLIFWELGGPFQLQILRFIRYYINFQTNSPIWWMSTFYVIEAPLLVIELYLMMKNSEKAGFYAACVGLIMGVVAFSTLSMVFAVNAAHPLYNSASFSVSFVLGAMICGPAAILIYLYIKKFKDIEKIIKALSLLMFFFLLAVLFIDLWTLVISSYTANSYLAKNYAVLTSGALALQFYFGELIIGLILPMILLIKSRFNNLKLAFFASILALIGVFFARYDNVIGGLLVRVESDFLPKIEYVPYSPSFAELAIFISAFGVILFVYALGKIFLNLKGY